MMAGLSAKHRDSVRLTCIAIAHLWFWNGNQTPMTIFIYPKEINSREMLENGQRVKITIELEDDSAEMENNPTAPDGLKSKRVSKKRGG